MKARSRKQIITTVLLGFAVSGATGCLDKNAVGPVPPTGQNPSLQDEPFPIPERADLFTSVTREYGPLVIETGEFTAVSTDKPWSSWWYPARDTYLFQPTSRGPAPLQKYDAFVESETGTPGGAADFERDKLFDPNAASWEGLCNAWSAASLLSPEPLAGATIDDVSFGVGDLKALLVKTYEQVDGLKQFGQRYNGIEGDDFADLYPDQFHKFLMVELFGKKRPFIMDKDPGIPVWNTPVWKAMLRIDPDAANAHIMHVDAWVFGASPFVDSYDYVGTLSVGYEYTYDLYGTLDEANLFHVVYGKWTGDSVEDHPDFVVQLPASQGVDGHRSNNKALDSRTVERLLERARSQPSDI